MRYANILKTKIYTFAEFFGVRLYDYQKPVKVDKEIHRVVQLDLRVICDTGKLTNNESQI